MTDAKFRWFEAMNHDGAIPLAQRAIIGYCGVRYAKADQGFVICVTQRTIAANLHTTRKTVNEAFRSGRERGWLMKVAERQRGTGYHGGDTWKLSKPRDLSNENDTQEWSNSNDTQLQSCVTGNAELSNPSGPSWVTEDTELSNAANSPTSENDGPKGIYQGSLEGFSNQGVSAEGAASDRNGYPFNLFEPSSPPRTKPSPRHVTSDRIEPETNGHVVDEPTGPPCSHPVCDTPATTDGMCGRHWATSQTYGRSRP